MDGRSVPRERRLPAAGCVLGSGPVVQLRHGQVRKDTFQDNPLPVPSFPARLDGLATFGGRRLEARRACTYNNEYTSCASGDDADVLRIMC